MQTKIVVGSIAAAHIEFTVEMTVTTFVNFMTYTIICCGRLLEIYFRQPARRKRNFSFLALSTALLCPRSPLIQWHVIDVVNNMRHVCRPTHGLHWTKQYIFLTTLLSHICEGLSPYVHWVVTQSLSFVALVHTSFRFYKSWFQLPNSGNILE